MIPEPTVEKILSTAKLEDFVTGAKKAYGQNKLYVECPACHHHDPKKKQGLIIDTVKNIGKCFKCDQGYGGPVDFLMKTENMGYPDALRKAAGQYGIFIEEEAPLNPPGGGKRKPKSKKKSATPKQPETPATTVENPDAVTETANVPPPGGKRGASFCDKQLEDSGLGYDDVRVAVKEDDGTERQVTPFCQGTRDQYGNIIEHRGDDMLIKYYDLDGRPVMYKPEKGTQMRHLVRIRWQNPAAHIGRDGWPIKYQSPAGSGSHIYNPERLRLLYKQARPIDTLFIQEGEKKAEKACKHGVISQGIMGINNLGNKSRLPDDIQFVVQRNGVKRTCFLLDADWMNLSDELKNGQPVDSRPRQFFAAVRNYKEYMRTLSNLGYPVEIYFGHILYNAETKEKGVDDLLNGSLKGREEELKADFEFAFNEKTGKGKYVQVYKITMLPDSKIADFWLLNDADAFARFHKKRLEKLKEFKLKGYLRRFDETGKLEMCQQLLPEEEFWDEDVRETRTGELKKTLTFDYVNAMNFLQNRGFFRFQMRSGAKELIRIENRVVTMIDHTDVKDFTKEFCREIKRNDVLNMLMRGGPQYLGPEKLTNLDVINLNIERATTEKQCLFFEDKIWEITAEGVKEINYGQFPEYIWKEKIIRHKVKVIPNFIEINQLTEEVRPKLGDDYADIETGEFFIDYSDQAEKSHFMQFIRNTSHFQWRKDKGMESGEITLEDQFLNSRHVVNKMTAIGYLLHDYKDANELKAVIGMDGKISEVGASNGRSGKSIIGVAISKLIPQVIIDGKNKKLDDDNFRYHEVTEKTKNVFFDDIRANFDFESLFQVITGGMNVNQKSGLRFTLSQAETPKLLLTTNHAINGTGSSFADRQAFMVFSDFYNDTHKPVNDFGDPFWSDGWGSDQWNLFFNVMAWCLVLYFRSKNEGWAGFRHLGIVPPPMEDVEKRKLRQTMGENFLTWADAYYDWDSKTKTGNLNQRLVRKELYDLFLNENPQERKYTTQTRFKEKVAAFCLYHGYDLNPTRRAKDGRDYQTFKRLNPETAFIGDMDKTGGKEYFTIANKEFNEVM